MKLALLLAGFVFCTVGAAVMLVLRTQSNWSSRYAGALTWGLMAIMFAALAAAQVWRPV